MHKVLRDMIHIDESRCNGCGACIPSCKEGALQIVNGKARVVRESYCDGLGACLGSCPQGALTIERREVEVFTGPAPEGSLTGSSTGTSSGTSTPCGCPSAMARTITVPAASAGSERETPSRDVGTRLSTWPIKLALISPSAPWLQGAKLTLMADCVGPAASGLQQKFIEGRAVAIACPKLDDVACHVERLAALIAQGKPASLEVVMMEVPCCRGLLKMAQDARALAGSDIPITATIVRIEGGSSHPLEDVQHQS